MIITTTCDLCGWNNDNNNGPCRKCGGQVEERRIKGRWRTVIVKPPSEPMQSYYNPDVIESPSERVWRLLP